MLVFKIPFLVSLVTGDADKEVDLEQYFQTKIPLHCTTQFCDYGKAEGAKEYAELQVGHSLEETLSSTSLALWFKSVISVF